MVHLLTELAERDIPEHALSVIVEDPQGIGLMRILLALPGFRCWLFVI
jgi:hypothetical protein